MREVPTAATAESVPAARRLPVRRATCCVVFALSVGRPLSMMGVDTPTRVFGLA